MKRTTQQNKAIHVFCRELAQALNEAGAEMKVVLEAAKVDIPWDEDRVKEVIWRAIQIPATGKKSTTDLDTKDVNEIYEIINRFTSQNFGVYVPFPSYEKDENN